jgi:hypothetical protein
MGKTKTDFDIVLLEKIEELRSTNQIRFVLLFAPISLLKKIYMPKIVTFVK